MLTTAELNKTENLPDNIRRKLHDVCSRLTSTIMKMIHTNPDFPSGELQLLLFAHIVEDLNLILEVEKFQDATEKHGDEEPDFFHDNLSSFEKKLGEKSHARCNHDYDDTSNYSYDTSSETEDPPPPPPMTVLLPKKKIIGPKPALGKRL